MPFCDFPQYYATFLEYYDTYNICLIWGLVGISVYQYNVCNKVHRRLRGHVVWMQYVYKLLNSETCCPQTLAVDHRWNCIVKVDYLFVELKDNLLVNSRDKSNYVGRWWFNYWHALLWDFVHDKIASVCVRHYQHSAIRSHVRSD